MVPLTVPWHFWSCGTSCSTSLPVHVRVRDGIEVCFRLELGKGKGGRWEKVRVEVGLGLGMEFG